MGNRLADSTGSTSYECNKENPRAEEIFNLIYCQGSRPKPKHIQVHGDKLGIQNTKGNATNPSIIWQLVLVQYVYISLTQRRRRWPGILVFGRKSRKGEGPKSSRKFSTRGGNWEVECRPVCYFAMLASYPELELHLIISQFHVCIELLVYSFKVLKRIRVSAFWKIGESPYLHLSNTDTRICIGAG